MSTLLHGGRLLEACRRHPAAPRPFIDLSTGINPDAYPFTPPPASAWQRLPEPEHVAQLEAAAARTYGAPDPACVVASPGTQALIQLLPSLRPQKRIAIPGPTYAEHAAIWQAAGAQVDPALGTARAAVLCNPNNPDGTRHAPSALLALGLGLLIVDEAFADFEPGLTLAPALPHPGLVILRSFGKAYGLAGLRLGFALAEPALATRIRTALGPWAVSGPAITIGDQALSDRAWQTAAAARAHTASNRLRAVLTQAGHRAIGGTALFQLAEGPPGLADALAEAGILVRSFPDQPGRFRFGLPPDEPAWTRLQAALI